MPTSTWTAGSDVSYHTPQGLHSNQPSIPDRSPTLISPVFAYGVASHGNFTGLSTGECQKLKGSHRRRPSHWALWDERVVWFTSVCLLCANLRFPAHMTHC